MTWLRFKRFSKHRGLKKDADFDYWSTAVLNISDYWGVPSLVHAYGSKQDTKDQYLLADLFFPTELSSIPAVTLPHVAN